MTRRAALALVGLGLALRLAAMPLWGTFDTDEWKAWSSFAVKEGLSRVYGPPDRRVLALGRMPRRNFEWQGVGRAVDYPPGSMIVLWAEGKLYETIDPALPSDRRFNTVINLAPLLGSLAILALLWRSSREDGPLRGLGFWLNPAVFLAAPVLGYQDTIFGAFGVAAVLALMRCRYVLASALVAAAGLLKPQGILLVPVLLAVVLREAKPATWIRCALAGLGVGVLVFLPWWSRGYLLSALEGAFRPLGEAHLSALGLNLWWVAAYVMKWAQAGPWPVSGIVEAGDFQSWAGLNPALVSGALLSLGTVAVLWLLLRRMHRAEGSFAPRWPIPLAVMFQVHAYAFAALSVHENHTLLAVFLAPLLLGAWPRAGALLVATSSFAFVNLLLALRFGEGITTRAWFLGLPCLPLLDALFVLAAASHGALLLAMLRLAASGRQDASR